MVLSDSNEKPRETAAETDSLSALVDEAVARARRLFEEVRATKKIPLAELRKELIPIVHEAADGNQAIRLFASLQGKEDYTYRHLVAVGAISNLIGKWMGLGRQELLQLTTAALLHDVGKMAIPPSILNKPDKLTEEEYALMKNHTVLGYELIKETVGASHRQALVALQHHERMDGSGYPFGITGPNIDLFSRIVAVADLFHAMASERVYRHPSPFYEVLSQMGKDAFGTLDPVVTRLFVEKTMSGLIGYPVRLTDGSEGIVLLIHTYDPTRPLVRTEDRFVDLSKDGSVQIAQIL
ncbi:HD-GYP domain-containing protein [Paenibacillus flagellatus]|uniref:HD-GYP domain-containing protein n=1 Tax=Paenibacillus flagellatus TaxID=2211139 RepID=A0A2V5K4A3_9BACL|nr:HD-GYP domain-containing protein [Paenibacillus flagellatus]PYI54048.1 HD-GYP domain-containing protein [Paenibacillus flagellatus]